MKGEFSWVLTYLLQYTVLCFNGMLQAESGMTGGARPASKRSQGEGKRAPQGAAREVRGGGSARKCGCGNATEEGEEMQINE